MLSFSNMKLSQFADQDALKLTIYRGSPGAEAEHLNLREKQIQEIT
jgi:hypothetical protein